MEEGSAPSEAGYNSPAVAGAVLATLFFPLIALIAALILMGNEINPQKRSQLRTWAWASGAMLVLGGLIFAVLLASVNVS
jgi:hypothetical protein